MRKFNFRRVMMVMAVAAMTISAQAQYLRSSYFMEGASSRLRLNPGLQPTRGYINTPVIGAFNVSASSNTLGIKDIIDVIDDGDDIFSNNKLYNRLKTDNNLNVNLNTDILSFGWYKGKNFWTVNVGIRMDVGARLNKGMFDFMKDTKGSGFDIQNMAGKPQKYNMDNQQVRLSAYGEVGLGFSRRFTEKLTVGARVKALLGLARAELNIDQFNVDMDIPNIPSYNDGNYEFSPSDWEGKRYEYNAHGNVVTTMKGGGITFDQTTGMIEDFDFEAKDMGLSGYGFGIDLGASYEVFKNFTVSAAVLDLGFLKWKKGETRMGIVDGHESTTIDQSNYDKYIGGDFLSLERFDFQEVENPDYKTKSRLQSTMILAAEYAFFNKKLSVGAMYSAHFVEPKTLNDITFSATFRPRNWFNIAASYSPVLSDGKSMGLALKMGPLFLGTDYMYFGNNSKSVNGFIGIQIPLGSKRKAYSEL